MLPDHLIQAISGINRAVYTPAVYGAIYVFASLILLIKPLRFILGALALLGVMELLHFCYLVYFGGVIDANVIMYALAEHADVADAGIAVSLHLFYTPFLVLLPYGAACFCIARYDSDRLKIPLVGVLVICIVATVPYKIISSGNPVKYFPIDAYPSFANSYLTASMLVANHLPHLVMTSMFQNSSGAYARVSVAETGMADEMTIVLVMSESLAPQRMSLFGFERPTTPMLETLSSNPMFVAHQGIAAGVGTLTSFYSFWNGVRDPKNQDEFARQTTNIFRLAKNHGFHTTFISSQGNNLLRGAGTRFLDDLITRDSAESDYAQFHDEMLLKHAKQIALGGRNLIVLHQRSAHGPYAHNYRYHEELAIFPTTGLGYADYQRNSYDNAVRYSDYIIYQLLDFFRSTVQGPLYFIVTSDHGQLLGDNAKGLFGHGRLESDIARVPVLFFMPGGDRRIVERVKRLHNPTHFELTELISNLLGYEITDPNAEAGVYYVNGTGSYGRHGYIRVIKSPEPGGATAYNVVPAG